MQNQTPETVFYRIPTGGTFSFGDRLDNLEIEIRPMDFMSEKLLLHKLGQLVKTALNEKVSSNSNLSDTLLAFKDLLVGSLDFEWLDRVPELVKIITDSYELNLETEKIKKIPLPVMTELIIRQIETDRESSRVASDFFTGIVKKIPALDQVTELLKTVNLMMESSE